MGSGLQIRGLLQYLLQIDKIDGKAGKNGIDKIDIIDLVYRTVLTDNSNTPDKFE